MSTKTQSTGTSAINYDPGSLSQYQQNIGQIMPMLRGMASNPFGNPFFQLSLQQGMKGATQAGQNSMNALMQNMRTSGMSGSAGQGFQQAMTSTLGRMNASNMSNVRLNASLAALQRQMQAAGMASAFTPLLSGENSSSTQTTSGTGTWLPQLIGSAISGAMAAGTGGMSTLAGAGMSSLPMMSASSAGFGGGNLGGLLAGPVAPAPNVAGIGNPFLPMPSATPSPWAMPGGSF